MTDHMDYSDQVESGLSSLDSDLHDAYVLITAGAPIDGEIQNEIQLGADIERFSREEHSKMQMMNLLTHFEAVAGTTGVPPRQLAGLLIEHTGGNIDVEQSKVSDEDGFADR